MRSLMFSAAAVLMAGTVCAAKTTQWNVAGGGNFNDAANWDNGVPAAGDTVKLVTSGPGVVFTNDIENLSIGSLKVTGTASAANPCQIVGNALTVPVFTSSSDLAVKVPLYSTSDLQLQRSSGSFNVYGPVATTNNLYVITDSAMVELAVVFHAPVFVGGSANPWGNTSSDFRSDVTVKRRFYYGKYWTGARVDFRNGKVDVADMDIGAATYNFYTSDALVPTTVLTWDLKDYLAGNVGSSGKYCFDCATMTIDRPHCDVVPVKKDGTWNGAYLLGTSASNIKNTLTMKATASDVSYARFVGGLSLVYDPQGSHTLVCSNSVHTMNGTVTVKGGALKFNGATTLANVTKVTVEGGTFELDSTTANALAGATALKVANGATFRATGAAAGSPFAAEGIARVDVAGTGKLALGEGVAFTAQVLMVKGVFPAAKTYTGEGYGEGEVEEAPWIEGPGRVTVVNTGYTSWKAAVSGNWSDATKWTGGVPTKNLKTYVSAEGASDYTVTVDGGEMPASIVFETAGAGKATLSVQAATFTNASLTVGRNATVEVPAGGSFWYQGVPDVSGSKRTSPVKPSVTPTAANTLVKIQDGGAFKVTGGSAVFANYVGYVAVGGSDGSAGTVAVSAGTLKFARDYSQDRIVVYKGGLMDFSGTGAFNPVGLGCVMGVVDAGANPGVVYRGSALDKGDQWFTGQGDTVYDLKTNPFETTPGEFVVAVSFPDGTTVEAMTHHTTVNVTNTALAVGKNHFVVAGGTPNGSIYNACDEVGVLNVLKGGRVDYNGSQPNDGLYFTGLTLGYGAFSYFPDTFKQIYGELNVMDGGAFTNLSGNTSIGVSRGSGRICVDGGSFRHGAAGKMFLVGVAGGTADCVLKDGTFSVNANDAYIGGAWTNVFYQGRYLYTWGWRPKNHSAVGTFRQEGGTAKFAHRVMLGVDGRGTIEQVGSAGTFTAGTLVFSNTTFNANSGGTAKFVCDASGVRPVAVTDKLTIGANAKLSVDTSALSAGKYVLKLFTFGSIEGAFAADQVEVTGRFAKKAKLVYGTKSVRLVVPRGLMAVVR